MFDVLSQCFSSNARMNEYLWTAVKVVKTTTGTVSQVLNVNHALRTDIVLSNNTDQTLFSRFFREVRNNKVSEDNLGEEMISICGHLLANIPEMQRYKYIVMTEDKGAVGLINNTQINIEKHLKKKALIAVTTVALGKKMFGEYIFTTKEQVEAFISTGVANNVVKIVASEAYELSPQETTMDCGNVAEKITQPNAIYIYY